MLVLEGLVGLHRTIQLQLLQHTGWGTDWDHCDTEWFALEKNREHSVIFETAPKYCILDSFVDYDHSSIYSQGFLLTVVDTPIPGPFSSLIPKMLMFTLAISCLTTSNLP